MSFGKSGGTQKFLSYSVNKLEYSLVFDGHVGRSDFHCVDPRWKNYRLPDAVGLKTVRRDATQIQSAGGSGPAHQLKLASAEKDPGSDSNKTLTILFDRDEKPVFYQSAATISFLNEKGLAGEKFFVGLTGQNVWMQTQNESFREFHIVSEFVATKTLTTCDGQSMTITHMTPKLGWGVGDGMPDSRDQSAAIRALTAIGAFRESFSAVLDGRPVILLGVTDMDNFVALAENDRGGFWVHVEKDGKATKPPVLYKPGEKIIAQAESLDPQSAVGKVAKEMGASQVSVSGKFYKEDGTTEILLGSKEFHEYAAILGLTAVFSGLHADASQFENCQIAFAYINYSGSERTGLCQSSTRTGRK